MLQRGRVLSKALRWRADCVTCAIANSSLPYSTRATDSVLEVAAKSSERATTNDAKKGHRSKRPQEWTSGSPSGTTHAPSESSNEAMPEHTPKVKIRFFGSHGSIDSSDHEERIRGSCAERMSTIRLADLEAKDAEREARLLRTKPICSYSWDPKYKKLFVPGAPPRFSPEPFPININDPVREAKRQAAPPSLALRPHLWRAFESIKALDSPFDFSSIDIVCSSRVLETLLVFCDRGQMFPGVTVHLVNQTLFLDLPLFQQKVGYGYSPYLTCPEHEALRNAYHYRWNSYTLRRPGQQLRLAVYTDVETHTNEIQDLKITEETSAVYVRDTTLVRLGKELPNNALASFRSHRMVPDYGKPIFSRISRIIKVYFPSTGNHSSREVIRKCEETQPNATTRRRWINSGYKLISLLGRLKEVAQTSRHGVCIAIGSGRLHGKESLPRSAESNADAKVDVFEPELDPLVLDMRNVYMQYRVTPELLPDFLIREFWNRKRPSEATKQTE